MTLGEFNSNNLAYQTVLVPIWELGEVVGPLLLAPFSERYGRFVAYNIACILFIVFSLACPASTSLQMLCCFSLPHWDDTAHCHTQLSYSRRHVLRSNEGASYQWCSFLG